MVVHLKKKSKLFCNIFVAFLPASPSLFLARTCQGWMTKDKFTAQLLEMAQTFLHTRDSWPRLRKWNSLSALAPMFLPQTGSQQMFVEQNYLLSKHTHKHTHILFTLTSLPKTHSPKMKTPSLMHNNFWVFLGYFQLLQWLSGDLPVGCPPPTHRRTQYFITVLWILLSLLFVCLLPLP